MEFLEQYLKSIEAQLSAFCHSSRIRDHPTCCCGLWIPKSYRMLHISDVPSEEAIF